MRNDYYEKKRFYKKNPGVGAVNHTDYPQEAYELGKSLKLA